MNVRERARPLIGTARRFIGDGIRRGRREAQIRRLEWQVDRQKAALGKVVYPLLQDGQVQTEVPEVRQLMTRIGALVQSLDELQTRSPHGGTDELPRNEDEAQWASEGGRNIG